MPSALICPRCGAPLVGTATACEYCRIRFDVPYGTKNRPVDEPPPVQTPEGWKQYLDPWYGFAVAHPPGWWVNALPGSIGIREDPAGITVAVVMTFPNDRNQPARDFFQKFLLDIRQVLPDFTAWEAPGNSNRVDQLAVRFQTTLLGVALAGFYDVSVQKGSARISGFSCPVNAAVQKVDTFRKILASFRPAERMARKMYHEPTEDAYTIWAPEGWEVNLQLNRQNINNMGTLRYMAKRETQGLAQAGLPDIRWTFTETMNWGMPNLNPVMPYMPANFFCQNFIAAQAAHQCQEMKVERIVDRPDLALGEYVESRKIGMDPAGYEVTHAYMDIVYRENGVLLRQRGLVRVFRPRMMLIGGIWNASLNSVMRAPVEEWDALEPVLIGIIDSNQLNPAWKAQEDANRVRYLAYSAADRVRRQHQISQTISDTSDMMYQSYENRNRSEDRIAHEYSNATLGYQDMTDPVGSPYNVPSGYDQYWLDNSNTLQVGNWLTNPDPTWRKLEPS